MVERDLAKVEVAGSSPVIRLKRVSEKVLAFFVLFGLYLSPADKKIPPDGLTHERYSQKNWFTGN